MRVTVFLGPTLSREEAMAVLPARYMPPVRRGDVLAAMRAEAPDAIAIVDGVFEQVPSVWHKELLWALSEGVELWGAASMGALRAAELAQFGMRGHGAIFEAYARGRFEPFEAPFEDDDEVAVVHGPSGLQAVSTLAMVDIRASLVAAAEAGVIDAETRDAVAAAAKAMFYKARGWPAVLGAAGRAGVAAPAIEALTGWLPGGAVSLKRRDALGLLAHLAEGPAPAPPPPFRFERTLLWEIAVAGSDAAD